MNTVLRTAILAVLVLPTMSAQATSIDITGLYNTGEGLSQGQVDPNYAFTYSGTGAPFTGKNPAYVQASTGGVSPINGLWVASNSPVSNWITPSIYNGNYDNQGSDFGGTKNGVYTYTTTFTESGSTPSLSGNFTADNEVTALLNGNVIGIASAPYGFAWRSWFTFGTSDASDFVINGTNTLQFVVTNFGGPTGLLVDMQTPLGLVPTPIPILTPPPISTTPTSTTPLPAAVWMVGSALAAGFPMFRRKQNIT